MDTNMRHFIVTVKVDVPVRGSSTEMTQVYLDYGVSAPCARTAYALAGLCGNIIGSPQCVSENACRASDRQLDELAKRLRASNPLAYVTYVDLKARYAASAHVQHMFASAK